MKHGKLIVAGCLLCAVSMVFMSFAPFQTHIYQADREALTTFPENLQNVADMIVIASKSGNSENVLFPNRDFGYTKTIVEVNEVFKGDAAVGDHLTITEECYTTDFGAVLWTSEGYLPMKAGNTYLLFLSAYPDESSRYEGMYFVTDLEYGKYVIPRENLSGTTRATFDMQIGEYADTEKYAEWYAFVMREYLK